MRSWVAIESDTFQIPAAIKVIEKKKKLELNSLCPWEVCNKRDGHKMNRAKGCKYYGKTDDDAFIKAMKEYLLEAYPEYYGELIFHQQQGIPLRSTLNTDCSIPYQKYFVAWTGQILFVVQISTPWYRRCCFKSILLFDYIGVYRFDARLL